MKRNIYILVCLMLNLFQFQNVLICFPKVWATDKQGITIRGIYLGDDGGGSGTATGTISILTDDGIQEISYQKPFEEIFGTKRCRDLGAKWTVVLKTNGTIESIQCKGEYDISILSATKIVKDYLKSIINRDYKAAYRLLGNVLRQSCPYRTFVEENENIEYIVSDLMPFNPSSCLCITASEPGYLIFSVDLSCGLTQKGNPILLELDLSMVKNGSWHISKIRRIQWQGNSCRGPAQNLTRTPGIKARWKWWKWCRI